MTSSGNFVKEFICEPEIPHPTPGSADTAAAALAWANRKKKLARGGDRCRQTADGLTD